MSEAVGKKGFITLLVLLLSWTLGALAQSEHADESYEEREARLVTFIAETEDFADWLTNYEGWQGSASPHDENNLDGGWSVEFHDAEGEEWLGYANVNVLSSEIYDSFIPRPLPEDQLTAGKARVQTLVLADPEVAARLTDPLLWDIEADYDRFEVHWRVDFYRGLEHLRVIAQMDDEFYIEGIRNEVTFNEEKAVEHARDEAIRLAYEEVGDALDGLDDWRTYTERQGGGRWSVSFVAGGNERFFALVDVENGQVLEAEAREE